MKPSERKALQNKWRKRREKSGLNITAFSEKYRFDKGQLSRWETGIWRPSTSSVERIENALKAEGV
jgi:transcriptional regulator with XRE-family HTH domain